MYLQVFLPVVILATNAFLMQSRQEYEQVTSKWPYWIHCKLCDIMIAVCWQDWTDTRERLLWPWTKAAMMLDWGCSTLD